jgi:hypothetical protein
MTISINSAQSAPASRRPRKSAAELIDELERAEAAEAAGNLPVPVGRARTVHQTTSAANAAAIEAQLLGERRGLRAGAAMIEAAQVSYNRTEWSGSSDRRAAKGRAARTEI